MVTRFFAILLCGPVCWADAVQVELAPDADTGISSVESANNSGKAPSVILGGVNKLGSKGRVLLHFNIEGSDAIPPGASIQSVSLRFRVLKKNSSTLPVASIQLYRMLKLWTEGKGSNGAGVQDLGSPAETGETTWKSRSQGIAEWGTAGGESGVDYAGIRSAAVTIDEPNVYDVASTEVLVGTVQAWLDEPATNFGWMLINDSEDVLGSARRIGTRETVDGAPKLTITYLPKEPVDTNSVGVATVTSGQFRYPFIAEPNLSYVVEFRDSLESGSWNLLKEFPAESGKHSETATDSIGDRTRRFYRLSRRSL